jgi:hypothetical protein
MSHQSINRRYAKKGPLVPSYGQMTASLSEDQREDVDETLLPPSIDEEEQQQLLSSSKRVRLEEENNDHNA